MNTRHLLADIEQRFDELRQDIVSTWGESRVREGLLPNVPRSPRCDLIDEPDAFTLSFELPGMEKQDVLLDVDARGAHVRAAHQSEKNEERKGILRQERASRSFERYVAFPQEVSPDGARASFKNGVLEVHVPKVTAERRDPRHLDIA